MYLEINEKLIEKVKKITGFDYKSKAELVTYDDIVSMIEDLTCEYEVLQEKYEDLERDLEDNYIHRPMSDYTGDADDDRF
jgi:hypothetical protein